MATLSELSLSISVKTFSFGSHELEREREKGFRSSPQLRLIWGQLFNPAPTRYSVFFSLTSFSISRFLRSFLEAGCSYRNSHFLFGCCTSMHASMFIFDLFLSINIDENTRFLQLLKSQSRLHFLCFFLPFHFIFSEIIRKRYHKS